MANVGDLLAKAVEMQLGLMLVDTELKVGDSMKGMRKKVLETAEACRKAQARYAQEQALRKVKVEPVAHSEYSSVASHQLSTAVVAPRSAPVNIRAFTVRVSEVRQAAKDPNAGILARHIVGDDMLACQLVDGALDDVSTERFDQVQLGGEITVF